jgi:hypothetical protein
MVSELEFTFSLHLRRDFQAQLSSPEDFFAMSGD